MANNRSWRRRCKQNRKTKRVKISKKKCLLKGIFDSKTHQPAQEKTRRQEQDHAPQRVGWRIGMSAVFVGMSAVLQFWRDPECKFCYICGEDNHEEFFCPFNYLYGIHELRTCKARCPPGKHLVVSSRHREFLRCFVRVSNLPPNFRHWHLGKLCRAFGPMRMWHVPMLNDEVCRGFGFAIFKTREHAEAAIEGLNGKCVGGHDVRLDWAYPCI
ncbi:unnamed protein product [Urochloa humidicola]